MQKPTSLAVGVFGSALVAALAWGCGLTTEGGDFYEIVEEGDAGVDERDASTKPDASGASKDAGSDASPKDGAADDAGLDGSTDPDAEPDDDAGPDGSDELDAAPPDDADTPDPDAGDPDSGDPDASAPDASDTCVIGADPCDEDCDGVLATSCGGDDCCDTDPDVFPGQTAFFETANACGDFDYDCNGSEDKRSGAGSACERKAFSCEEKQGFVAFIPDCGDRGAWVSCTGWTALGGCDSVFSERLQTCR